MPTNETKQIAWDKTGEHFYETGVSKGVLYPIDAATNKYEKGVAWNGLTSMTESPEGAEVTALYADNIKYLNLMSAEDFKGTIEAYTYPDEFAECDGSKAVVAGVFIGQQTRKKFGVCYRTEVGNDVTAEKGYKLHIAYNCLCSPSERAYETINDSPEAITFSWEFSTTPVTVTGHKPTASVTIDSTKIAAGKLALIEAALYGTDDANTVSAIAAKITGFDGNPVLLLPDEIVALASE